MFDVNQWVEEHREPFIEVSDAVWEYAELGYVEDKSAKALADVLAADGFKVTMNIGGMPTAFVAEYGEGAPVVAIMGEYDALPGMSQACTTEKQPLEHGGSGHACQHNLLGAASMAAAMAIKAAIEVGEAKGTVKFMGTPAEESDPAKAFMVRAGAFDDVDICLTWHPGDVNAALNMNTQAVLPIYYQFHGTTAHAAADPYNGRSALDAVELMNVGANYMREHITSDVRFHYIITNGGLAPNIVPEDAEVEYWIRAAKAQTVLEVYERINKVAQGAAMMTETEVNVLPGNGILNILPNTTIVRVLHEALTDLPDIEYTEEELDFALKMIDGLPDNAYGQFTSLVDGPPDSIIAMLRENPLTTMVVPFIEKVIEVGGSTDVGDITYAVPTAQFTTACAAAGTPGHSWQLVAQGRMSIGHKGMLHAAKVMAIGGIRFMNDETLVKQAKDEFDERLANTEVVSLLPDDAVPTLDKYKV